MTSPHAAQPGFDDEPERHLPEHHNPLPELSGPTKPTISPDAFVSVRDSSEFQELSSRFRRFSFPMTAAFLIWYFAYVLMSVYAKDFMSTPVVGNINIGVILGLFQFVSTFLITGLYIRHMNKKIDPISTKIRASLEEGEQQ